MVLAVPVLPIGNVAESAAIVYGALAAGWLVLNWRDARHGLLFVVGPVLAAFGLLPLIPLAVQQADGRVRRAAHAAMAVLAAALLAGVAGHELPLTGETPGTLGIGPLTPVFDASNAIWSALAGHPLTTAAAILFALAAALLPWARRFSPAGVAVVGFVVTAASVAVGAGVTSTVAVVAVWAAAGFSAATFLRAS